MRLLNKLQIELKYDLRQSTAISIIASIYLQSYKFNGNTIKQNIM